MSEIIILLFIVSVITYGIKRKVPIYETFIDGAKSGITTVAAIFPYILAVLCAIGVFRNSGMMDYLVNVLKPVFGAAGFPSEALPLSIIKMISGSGANASLADTLISYHPDSFTGRLASVIAGSNETTIYITALYFGSVNIKKTQYALPVALSCDIIGMFISLIVCRIFFG
jgi:spore maturation protein B